MKRSKSNRASKPQTVRLEADAFRIVTKFAADTGMTVSAVVNRLVQTAWFALSGELDSVATMKKLFAAKVVRHREEVSQADALAALRRNERLIQEKLPPVHIGELTKPK